MIIYVIMTYIQKIKIIGGNIMSLLKSVAKSKVTKKFMYPEIEGFEVELKLMTKEVISDLYNRCSTKEFNAVTKKMESTPDLKALKTLMADEVIIGWTGLTYEKANKLIPIDSELLKQAGKSWKDEIPATLDEKNALLDGSMDFDNWVSETIKSVAAFAEIQQKEEMENLK